MWTHNIRPYEGKIGEFSKITEEYLELEDADIQKISKAWVVIECSDLIGAVGAYSWRTNKIPLWLLVVLTYLRIPFKPVRNFIRDLAGRPKIIRNKG